MHVTVLLRFGFDCVPLVLRKLAILEPLASAVRRQLHLVARRWHWVDLDELARCTRWLVARPEQLAAAQLKHLELVWTRAKKVAVDKLVADVPAYLGGREAALRLAGDSQLLALPDSVRGLEGPQLDWRDELHERASLDWLLLLLELLGAVQLVGGLAKNVGPIEGNSIRLSRRSIKSAPVAAHYSPTTTTTSTTTLLLCLAKKGLRSYTTHLSRQTRPTAEVLAGV